MKIKILYLLIIGCFIISVGASVAAQEKGAIKGRVVDAQTGEGLAEASVSIPGTGWATGSGERGDFAFEAMPPGVYRIAVRLFGYGGVSGQRIEVRSGETTEVTVALDVQPIVFEELIVTAGREALYPQFTITDEEIGERHPKDIGEFLRSTPGMAAIKKGGTALDIVYRGFRMDQLNVQIDGGVQVFGGCPNRMDPPTSHVQAEDLEKIEIIKGPHAVRYGASFGGLINLAMKRPRQSEDLVVHTRLESGYESNGSGKRARAVAFGSNRRFDFFASGGSKDYGDYSDGEGNEIESGFQVRDYSIKLGWKPDAGQRLQISGRQAFVRDALYPALPMDADVDDTGILALDYSRRFRGGMLRSLSAKAYVSAVDHVMSNQRKPTFAKMHAETDADTRTTGGRVELGMKLLDGNLFAGGDYRDLGMEGFRTREMMMGEMKGKIFEDIIWPDAHSRKVGLFGQFDRPLAPETALSLGLRFDFFEMTADNPETSFADMYGGDLDRSDVNPSVTASVTRGLMEGLELNLAAGLSRREPSITERYLYLLPVGLDAYDYLGNPEVDPEQNLQFDVGVDFLGERSFLSGGLFYAKLTDYISGRVEPGLKSRSPGVLGVKRFVNISSAAKFGGELEAGFRPVRDLLVRGQVAYTRGENGDSDQPLPEIPPLEGKLAARYDDARDRFWVELSERLVARQERIAVAFGETETPGFAVAGLAAGAKVGEYIRLTGGIDNLFDETYYEHLNRRHKIDGLSLSEAGRSFYLLVKLVK